MDDGASFYDAAAPVPSVDSPEASNLYRNFILMALLFSANHGAVTSIIALSSSFDAELGSYSVGILYGFYVLTAMLAGAYIVSLTSSKRALIGSLALYAVYVASYLVAAIQPDWAWPAIIFGASVGGVGAGLLWTAQGTYFKINASKYAAAAGKTEEEATGLFSSTFAALYLGLEVALKITGSLTATYGSASSKYFIYALYSIIALAATFAMTLVKEMVPDEAIALGELQQPGCKKVTAALTLLITNPKCALMVPTNVAFGLAAAFITAYIQGSVVAPIHASDDDDDTSSAEHHSSMVLLYSSLAVGVATVCSLPGFGFHWLRDKAGTPPVMLIGAASFCIVSFLSLTMDDKSLRHTLWLLYIIYGAGRAIWESTVKAIFSDFFTEAESPAAFANIILQSGSASTVAFFVFPGLNPTTKALLLFFASAMGFVCYFLADRIHKREKATQAKAEARSVPGETVYSPLDGDRA